SGDSARLDCPRSTSKSWLKSGCFGIRLKADAICCCSSADGLQTLSTFTLTLGGGGACCAVARVAKARPLRVSVVSRRTENFNRETQSHSGNPLWGDSEETRHSHGI